MLGSLAERGFACDGYAVGVFDGAAGLFTARDVTSGSVVASSETFQVTFSNRRPLV